MFQLLTFDNSVIIRICASYLSTQDLISLDYYTIAVLDDVDIYGKLNYSKFVFNTAFYYVTFALLIH